MNIFTYLVPLSLAAVTIVLILGVFNMMRGGPGNRSQKFMRMRVILQFVAIIIIMAALYFAGK